MANLLSGLSIKQNSEFQRRCRGLYWQAVRALAAGDQTLAKEKAAALRRCFAGRPDFLWQWELDARAVLILSENTIPDSHTLPYQDDFFETQLAKLEHDTTTFQ